MDNELLPDAELLNLGQDLPLNPHRLRVNGLRPDVRDHQIKPRALEVLADLGRIGEG